MATTGASKLISSDDMTAEGSCTMNSDVHRNLSVILLFRPQDILQRDNNTKHTAKVT